MNSFTDYFTDAVLRAPTIGSMLMCLVAALVGVIIFLRKQSLLGEALSHAAYPGLMLGVTCAGLLAIEAEFKVAVIIAIGAFFSALFGLWVIRFLKRRFKIRNDSALCFVLSAFFGIGLTLASYVQFAYTALYKQSLTYLYGQAATMTDIHIFIYGTLATITLFMIALLYKELQAITFDRDFAKSIGIHTHSIDTLVFVLIVLAVVIGIRSVGVILMSAMLIAPAAAARQYTHKLYVMFALAGFFGVLSAYFGNYLSVEISALYTEERIALPTGPMIVLVATAICLASLLLAPERGLFVRLVRTFRFRYRCIGENLLKAIWRFGPEEEVSFDQIVKYQSISPIYLKWILHRLARNRWVKKTSPNTYKLTYDGRQRAARIVRLHRLWEVYLADYLGVGVERVHRNAEEMEHIITPELEEELILLLQDPKKDPHHQPIPKQETL